jgi:RHS repeat-associated protein
LGENGPNGQTTEWAYGDNLHDELLQRITNKRGTTMLSEFLYTHDTVREGRLTSWSQQVGAATPSVYTPGYDDDNELTSVSITNATPNTFAYTYDTAANRLTETIGAATTTANFNSLNELTTLNGSATAVTNEWDAEQRLTAVNSGNERTEFTYDGLGRRVQIRKLVNSSEVSNRRFVWCDDEICEERDVNGVVTKRYFPQGMKIETGATAGTYFYTRDHLHSIRELIDNTGAVRARYSYDSYGRRTKVSGDLEADFGFTGMFWSPETSLGLTKFRAYDASVGRWLSRDPLYRAELKQGPNLYAYVSNNPINLTDPLGLQNVGPKAPPGGPAPDLPGQPGIGCVDPGDALEGIANCILCIMSFKPGDPGDPFTPGDNCSECLSIPPPTPCPPPPPPGPDCNSIPLMEGVPPPCTPKPPCHGGTGS